MTNFGWWQATAFTAGRFICCICFEAYPLDAAWEDVDGQRWDMCAACGPREEVDRRQASTPK